MQERIGSWGFNRKFYVQNIFIVIRFLVKVISIRSDFCSDNLTTAKQKSEKLSRFHMTQNRDLSVTSAAIILFLAIKLQLLRKDQFLSLEGGQ